MGERERERERERKKEKEKVSGNSFNQCKPFTSFFFMQPMKGHKKPFPANKEASLVISGPRYYDFKSVAY